MAEFEDKLNSILGNQEAMEQIMTLARSLSGEKGGGEPPAGSGSGREESPSEDAFQDEASEGERSGSSSQNGPASRDGAEGESNPPPDLSQLLGNLDPGMLQMGMRLMQEYRGSDDKNAALLQALRPFLREERRAKLDKALQLAQMTRLIRVVLGSLGERGEEEGV